MVESGNFSRSIFQEEQKIESRTDFTDTSKKYKS